MQRCPPEAGRTRKVSPFFPVTDRSTAEVNLLTTVTGRLGYAFDRTLLYAKGGYAGGDVESRVTDILTNVGGVCGTAVTGIHCHAGDSTWHNGWMVGAGIEHAISRNVTIGLEYNYIDLGSERSVTPTSPGASTIALDQSVDLQIQTVTGRVSFKFP
jgi:outer membrane immunogenic protein